MMVANVLFATMTICARLASASVGWATIGGARALGGAIVAALFALQRGASLRTRRPKLSWARSLFGTASMLTTFYALSAKDLAVGDAVTLFATAPLFIAVLSPLVLGEATGRSLWGVLLVAFGGVALVAGPHFSLGSFPAVCACMAAVFSACAMMFLRLMRSGHGGGPPDGPEAIAFHFAVVAFVAHAAIASFTFTMPVGRDALYVIGAGLSGGLAQLAMTRAYALDRAARLSAMGYIGTVLGFTGAIVLLGERPGWLQIVGAALVVGAGVVLAFLTSHDVTPPAPVSVTAPAPKNPAST